MIKDYFTVAEIEDILDVEMVSAHEIWDGALELEVDELIELAQDKDLSVDQLIK